MKKNVLFTLPLRTHYIIRSPIIEKARNIAHIFYFLVKTCVLRKIRYLLILKSLSCASCFMKFNCFYFFVTLIKWNYKKIRNFVLFAIRCSLIILLQSLQVFNSPANKATLGTLRGKRRLFIAFYYHLWISHKSKIWYIFHLRAKSTIVNTLVSFVL